MNFIFSANILVINFLIILICLMNLQNISSEKLPFKPLLKHKKSFDDSEEESDYSIGQIRRHQKRINKKKVTKIIHTCCLIDVDFSGRQTVTYKQFRTDTTNKDPKNIRRQAIRAAQAYDQGVLEQEKNRQEIISRVIPRPADIDQRVFPHSWNHPQNPFGNV